MAVAVLMAIIGAAAAVAAAAPAPALMLRRSAPLKELKPLRKLDSARFTKRSGVPEFGLLGLPGVYYTNVRLGSPSKQYSLQVDTGSDLMWVSCSSCTGCPATDDDGIPFDFYSPNSSSTSSNISCADDRCRDAIKEGHSVCRSSNSPTNQCGYEVAYAGAATSGYYVSDTIHFDTVMGNGSEQVASSSASVLFGCSISRSSYLQTDGIVGFGKNAPSVVLQLNSQGVSPKSFSHCLTSSEDGGGILVLGEIAEQGLEFTPLVSSQPRYNLNMEGISVNGENIQINPSLFTTSNTQGTFVDSGTSLSYLADGIFDPVINAIDNATPELRVFDQDGELCFIVPSRSKFSLLPNLTLHFEGGGQMRVGPENYLLRKGASSKGEKEDVLCIGFLRSKDLDGYQHITILGETIYSRYNLQVNSILGRVIMNFDSMLLNR
ncbi:hypothetical protein QYE76_018974 [Lolium multiflorum]|uniref:Peptidase A1 domain-containing protein n=1 Tax=Lolium multiflorum TaxID=4521 RepID=A0AAD8Q5V6_LOLMU|nr:hypothetical protein QYE76_018974 [Lolium multiflorum]